MKINTIILFLLLNTWILPQAFAPLAKGNKWIYKTGSNGTIAQTTVVSDTIINGFKFWILKSSGGSTYYCRYREEDSLNVFYTTRYPNPNFEYPYYKYKCKLGDIWYYQAGNGIVGKYTVKDVGVDSVFGTSVIYKGLISETGFSGSVGVWTDEYGCLSSGLGGVDFKLLGCVINDIAFGDTSLITTIDEAKNIIYPYSLNQNYPNPFNPSTTITYLLYEKGFVTLKVYNVLGKEVKTLVSGIEEIGKHEVVFVSNGLAGGVYFYTLIQGPKLVTKKMILLK